MITYLRYGGEVPSQRLYNSQHEAQRGSLGRLGRVCKTIPSIVFLIDQNTRGVSHQLDAIRQVSQSPSNLPYTFHSRGSSRRMCLKYRYN
jgi:hypothetical protein